MHLIPNFFTVAEQDIQIQIFSHGVWGGHSYINKVSIPQKIISKHRTADVTTHRKTFISNIKIFIN